MKQRLTNFLLHHLLGLPSVSDVITSDKAGHIYIGNRKITDNELNQLQAEVKAVEGFMIWKLMTETLKSDAYQRGFVSATNMDHLNGSKTILYVVNLQQSIMRVVKQKK